MQALKCTQHGEDFDVRGAIEHIRRLHASFIERPKRPGEFDAHGHMWYCFECDTINKDHRSFNSDNAMWTHLRRNHDTIIDCMIPS